MPTIEDFIRESNLIEGIDRPPLPSEVDAALAFMRLPSITIGTLCDAQFAFAPNKPLRVESGMDVRVGDHLPPPGNPQIVERLQRILDKANDDADPWLVHCEYETLHPFLDGNGRSGRLLWAWQMNRLGERPFALSFLHRWYYQTLSNPR